MHNILVLTSNRHQVSQPSDWTHDHVTCFSLVTSGNSPRPLLSPLIGLVCPHNNCRCQYWPILGQYLSQAPAAPVRPDYFPKLKCMYVM